MAPSTAPSQTRPRRANRVRYTYDSDSEPDLSTPPPSRTARLPRASRRTRSYREDSNQSDTLSHDSSSTSHSDAEPPLPPLRSLRLRQDLTNNTGSGSDQSRKRKTRSQPNKSTRSFASFKRRKTESHNRSSKAAAKAHVVIEIPSSGKIPPWQQLPYHILQAIMKYAAYPLYEEASRSTPAINWLCGVSALCKAFHEACIAALLYSPPLYPSDRARGLLSLLDKAKPITNYEVKIKCLEIEVKHLLIQKSGIDLNRLLAHAPLLERLRLYHNHDDLQEKLIWAQPSYSKDRWGYPQQVFDRLDGNNVVLKGFEWNGRFPRPMDVLNVLANAHARPCLAQLKEISFLNFTLPDKTDDDEMALAGALLASSLDKLPELQLLCFRNCNIINDAIIDRLPAGLIHLDFSNCPSLTSPILEKYLSVKGTSLTTLRLDGNQSMSLGFLTNLKNLCPRLQRLYIDLTYTDPTSYRDRDPLYDELLPDGSPTWPSSLTNIEIENLRQLSASEAEEFFNSLVNAATDLPYLKVLTIKAILKDASWRDRAEMRKRWMPKLQHVFLNTSTPSADSKKLEKVDETNQGSSNRQSTRIAKNHLKKPSTSDDTGESDTSGSQDPASANRSGRLSRQGRCDVVQLMISDQRPAQDQFHENDFLDDEPSGDEEWTGANEEQTGYAW